MRDRDSILLEQIYFEDVGYRGEHTASGKEDGAPLNDLTKVYPDDIYSDKAHIYYGHYGDYRDIPIFSFVKRYKNRPNAKVKIYRAVPKYAEGDPEKIKEIEKKVEKYYKLWKLSSFSNDDFKKEWEDSLSQLPQKVDKINQGDWVTIDKSYAIDHGRSALRGNYKILSKTVKAEDIYTSGDSIFEWGYDPS